MDDVQNFCGPCFIFHSFTTKKMEILEFKLNTDLATVYYNGGKPNLFRIHVDITLVDLKHRLSQFNCRHHFRNGRRVTDVEYHRPSVCSNGIVLFTNMKLQNAAKSVHDEGTDRARRCVD
jgi:hypothetical protein